MLVITASPGVCSAFQLERNHRDVILFVMNGSVLLTIHAVVIIECGVICDVLLFPLFLFPRDLDCLGVKNRILVALPVEEVLQTLNDLITYFQLPDVELEHEERQIKLRSLKNRQNLFKQEVSFIVKESTANQQAMKYQLITQGAILQSSITNESPLGGKEFDL